MIFNHLKTAFRFLLNNKTYAVINILGLSLGFFCFFLLNFYVGRELSFDKEHSNAYRLLQIETNENGEQREMATIGPRVGVAAKEQFPEIELVSHNLVLGRVTVGNDPGDRQYEGVTTIDPAFFEIFNFNFVEGSIENMKSQPNGILLTKSVAEKYFGSSSAVNKTLWTNQLEAVVAGVIEDFPANTHFDAEFMVTSKTAETLFPWWQRFFNENWDNNTFITYFKVRPNADIAVLNQKITRLAKENWPQEEPFRSEFQLQPVQDIHLYEGNVAGEINKSKGSLFYISVFFWISIVILLVACFNYTGLLNVAFVSRSKEIGVRKAIGAEKGHLLWQFFLESTLLTVLSIVIAIGLLYLSKPWMTTTFGDFFDWSYLSREIIALVILAGMVGSLLSVAYPSWLVSRMDAIRALREDAKKSSRLPFRKAIVLFQFVAAVALIACTIVFYRQTTYLQNKDLGFGLDGLLVVDINSGVQRSQFQAIKQEFLNLPEVQGVSVSSRIPGEWKNIPVVEVLKQGRADETAIPMVFVGADKDFLSTFDISLLEGQNFSGNIAADSTKILLNEAALKALGEEVTIGQWVEIPTVNFNGDFSSLEQPFKAQITGVVKDFHFQDFRQEIAPMIISFRNNPIHSIDYYTLKINSSNVANTIAALDRTYDSFDAENPMEYNFLNDQFERFFEEDIFRRRLLLFFTGVVIFITGMGLLAMTAFMLRQRTKEIGIRKILGATPEQIIGIIYKDFLWLVLLGSVIATPISWLFMRRWLQEFAYSVTIQWWIFAVASIAVLLIAFITISYQSLKAALVNPVNSLKQE